MTWNLYDYSRSFNGIGRSFIYKGYEVRGVEDPIRGELRVDYRKPGSKSWDQHYGGSESNMTNVFIELEKKLK